MYLEVGTLCDINIVIDDVDINSDTMLSQHHDIVCF